MNEWDSWKVGDTLIWNGVCPLTGKPLERDSATILSFAGNMYLSDGSVWDLKHWSPITRFWTLAAYPPYQKGDRVVRDPVDNGKIPAGTQGTVESVARDLVSILWDTDPETQHYAWPTRNSYFSKINTLQSPRPVLHCIRCGEFNEYAEPNQPDGTHRCWQCRKDPFR